ncbi:hypothetical protein DPMN_117981 [Dreissena polymorpha]|uniref:Uncharacterized protein n=1 Tax=Dreissena polymorpha TaxID=45954 RepID=A0A9D4GJZ4_DREPO|nr:hypothetical protein DPMN_117981 [Dreissena polymorpha]
MGGEPNELWCPTTIMHSVTECLPHQRVHWLIYVDKQKCYLQEVWLSGNVTMPTVTETTLQTQSLDLLQTAKQHYI